MSAHGQLLRARAETAGKVRVSLLVLGLKETKPVLVDCKLSVCVFFLLAILMFRAGASTHRVK